MKRATSQSGKIVKNSVAYETILKVLDAKDN